jgi:hypothetical protein
VVGLLLLSGCPDPAAQFIAGRLVDPCDGSWPVCTTIAGCLANNSTYLEGKLPGTRKMIVRTRGQASIKVSIHLKNEGAIGHQTRLEWNDASCGTVASEILTGADFFKEFEAQGEFSRTRNVAQEGDHLILFESDSTADYLLKVDVTEVGI